MAYELVHVIFDFLEPETLRCGVADYTGIPHFFSEVTKKSDSSGEFHLSPIDLETFNLVLEEKRMFSRWATAFFNGNTTLDTQPVLLEDLPRFTQIKPLLEKQLVIDPQTHHLAQGEFKVEIDKSEISAKPRILIQWTLV